MLPRLRVGVSFSGVTMVSTLRTRPNHYEMLGIEPTASAEEIARAFTREMSMFRPRPVGGVAEVSIAYETLRDPVKRRAYDESLGLGPKPTPPAPSWEAGAFFVRAAAHPAERLGVDPLHRPAPQRDPPAPAEPSVDARIAAITASLREIAKPPSHDVPPAAAVAAPNRPNDVGKPLSEAQVEEPVEVVEDGGIEWKRPVLAAGGLILGVALLGAWAGVEAGSEAEAQQPEQAVTVAVPPARSTARLAVLDTVPLLAEARPERRSRVAAHRDRRAATPPPQRALSDKEIEELVPVDVSSRSSGDGAAGLAEQAVAEAPAVAPTPARMPLSNATVARTIGRIGYSCGRVSSVVEGEGAGVFRVTCTSGQSYRAAPVGGRYHFRRLGRE